MKIEVSRDIEDNIRECLVPYMSAYVTVPRDAEAPFLRITCTGGSEANRIDTFIVTLEGYGSTDADALDLTRKAVGILKAQKGTKIAYTRENSKPQRYMDSVRPDLVRYRSTVLVTAHQETVEVNEDES